MNTSSQAPVRVTIVPAKLTAKEDADYQRTLVAHYLHQQQAKKNFLEALPTVVTLAKMNCSGGAYTAATLLLNLYNSREWRFNLKDLRGLSHKNWQACMDVLAYQAYATPDQEIHHYIKDGHQLMHELWDRYRDSSNFIGMSLG